MTPNIVYVISLLVVLFGLFLKTHTAGKIDVATLTVGIVCSIVPIFNIIVAVSLIIAYFAEKIDWEYEIHYPKRNKK